MERYIGWATEQARLLQSYLSSDDVEELILTRSFYSLLDNSTGSASRGLPLLEGELDARTVALASELKNIRDAVARWNDGLPLVVLDTNVYLHAPTDFTSLDLSDQVETDQWHFVIPIAIVDELDRAKVLPSSIVACGKESVRDRARRTLAMFEELIVIPNQVVRQKGSKFAAEILLDPPQHRRLSRTDDEIIARSAEVNAIAGRDVHLITYDTGMLMRARGAGLRPHKPTPAVDPSS